MKSIPLVLAIASFSALGCCQQQPETSEQAKAAMPVRLIVPDAFEGPVYLVHGGENASEPLLDDGHRVFRFGGSTVLRVRDYEDVQLADTQIGAFNESGRQLSIRQHGFEEGPDSRPIAMFLVRRSESGPLRYPGDTQSLADQVEALGVSDIRLVPALRIQLERAVSRLSGRVPRSFSGEWRDVNAIAIGEHLELVTGVRTAPFDPRAMAHRGARQWAFTRGEAGELTLLEGIPPVSSLVQRWAQRSSTSEVPIDRLAFGLADPIFSELRNGDVSWGMSRGSTSDDTIGVVVMEAQRDTVADHSRASSEVVGIRAEVVFSSGGVSRVSIVGKGDTTPDMVLSRAFGPGRRAEAVEPHAPRASWDFPSRGAVVDSQSGRRWISAERLSQLISEGEVELRDFGSFRFFSAAVELDQDSQPVWLRGLADPGGSVYFFGNVFQSAAVVAAIATREGTGNLPQELLAACLLGCSSVPVTSDSVGSVRILGALTGAPGSVIEVGGLSEEPLPGWGNPHSIRLRLDSQGLRELIVNYR